MSRYINADAVIQVLDKSRNHLCALSCSKDIVDKQIADVKDIPTADVRPNVRGKWIDTGNTDHVEKIYKCSACGYSAWGKEECTHFCGGCGAYMRGGA